MSAVEEGPQVSHRIQQNPAYSNIVDVLPFLVESVMLLISVAYFLPLYSNSMNITAQQPFIYVVFHRLDQFWVNVIILRTVIYQYHVNMIR